MEKPDGLKHAGSNPRMNLPKAHKRDVLLRSADHDKFITALRNEVTRHLTSKSKLHKDDSLGTIYDPSFLGS